MAIDFKEWNKGIIEEFRANAGKVGGDFEGAPLVLLNTVGAKSGEARTNPLIALHKGDDIAIVASMGGAPRNPDWYYNVLANPEVTVEVGTETKPVRARVADPDERARLYAEIASIFPAFSDYEKATDRTIPVVVLSPR